MKEKIFSALKLARGQNTSTSDRTLDKLATVLSLGITEETAIPNETELKALIAEIDGNISFVTAEAVKNAKPPTPPVPPTPPTPPAFDMEALKAEMAKLIEPLTQKVQAQEQKSTREALVAQAKQKFYDTYSISEVERPLCEKALDIHLALQPNPATTDDIHSGWKAQYEELRQVQGLTGLTPTSANNGGQGNKGNTQLDRVKEQLIREGKLPDPTKK